MAAMGATAAVGNVDCPIPAVGMKYRIRKNSGKVLRMTSLPDEIMRTILGDIGLGDMDHFYIRNSRPQSSRIRQPIVDHPSEIGGWSWPAFEPPLLLGTADERG